MCCYLCALAGTHSAPMHIPLMRASCGCSRNVPTAADMHMCVKTCNTTSSLPAALAQDKANAMHCSTLSQSVMCSHLLGCVHCVAAADVPNEVLVVQGVSRTWQLGTHILQYSVTSTHRQNLCITCMWLLRMHAPRSMYVTGSAQSGVSISLLRHLERQKSQSTELTISTC